MCKCDQATDVNPTPTTITETLVPVLNTSNICVLVHKKDNNKIEVSHHPSRSSEKVSPRNNDDDILVLRLCEMERVTRNHRNGKTLIRRHSHASSRSADLSFHTCKSASSRTIRSAYSSQHHHHHHHRATKKKPSKQNIASTDKPITPKQASEIIIVSDEFRRNALKQDVVIARQKNWQKSRMNPPKDLHRSMNDVRISVDNTSQLVSPIQTNGHSPKAFSKSVDNISFEQNEDDAHMENVDSVELVFISTEDLQRTDSRRNHNRNVIALNELNKSGNQIDRIKKLTADGRKKQLVLATDDFRRNSLRQRRHLKHIKEIAQQNGTASQETSVDDVSNKITSHAFHSYDEDQEELERKELHQSIVDDVKQVASVIIGV